jgi:hypothetical protein
MGERNRVWNRAYAPPDSPYVWDLNTATLTFPSVGDRGAVNAHIQVMGTVSACEGTYLWSWANGTLPAGSYEHVERVREFGVEHDLPLLTTGEWPGGRAEGMEMLAISSRILDAPGCFIEDIGDFSMFLAILRFEAEQPIGPGNG